MDHKSGCKLQLEYSKEQVKYDFVCLQR